MPANGEFLTTTETMLTDHRVVERYGVESFAMGLPCVS